ncbi:MAG: general stress protein [Chloroflexota bacterium]
MDAMHRYQNGGLVLASYGTTGEAEAAVRSLTAAGFSSDDVSVIARDEERAEQVSERTGSTGTDIGKGTGIGALAGGALGALGGLLAGATALAIPGVGIVLAGPLAAILGAAGAGAVSGGLIGALVAAGVSEGEAEHYKQRLEAGDVVVAVAAGNREAEARDILRSGMSGYAGSREGGSRHTNR